jgi:hypothetical protein
VTGGGCTRARRRWRRGASRRRGMRMTRGRCTRARRRWRGGTSRRRGIRGTRGGRTRGSRRWRRRTSRRRGMRMTRGGCTRARRSWSMGTSRGRGMCARWRCRISMSWARSVRVTWRGCWRAGPRYPDISGATVPVSGWSLHNDRTYGDGSITRRFFRVWVVI